MGNFNRGRSGGGRGWERRPVEMHQAVCDKCRQNCEVPFRPTQGKPIFCNNCFDRNKGSASGQSPSYPQYKEQFEQLNNKLDKILTMLAPVKDPEDPDLG